ncbi:MAG: sensor domain-containing diguanylate cyclase [Aliarcobacter sp.]|nr:sensor domain-containing diguanylate cyclase [Aliarcobacter sp.]
MKRVVKIKEFCDFLRINKNLIIDNWLNVDEVKNIFAIHQLVLSSEDRKIFYEFFDCLIGVMQWDVEISECPVKTKFLQILNKSFFNVSELFTLLTCLKNSLIYYFYKEGISSFVLLDDVEKNFLKISNELFNTYEQIKDKDIDYRDDHSNLLNEYKKAVDLSNIVSKTNPKGIITYVNDKFCEVSGYKREELIGKPHNIVRHPTMPSQIYKELWDTIKAKKTWNGLITNIQKDGKSYTVYSTVVPILDIDGDVVEYIAIRHDVTEFEQAKEQLSTLNKAMKHKVDELYSMAQTFEEQASIDVLTGVFNRMKFEEFFDLEFQKAKIQRNQLSIILLDIDNFKLINDSFGHDIGDDVLRVMTKLISQNIRSTDTLSRWGGEEFVILLPGTSLEQAKLVATNLKNIISKYKFDTLNYDVTCSFGVAVCNDSDNKETLFKRVDTVLYKAKNSGKNIVIAEDEI